MASKAWKFSIQTNLIKCTFQLCYKLVIMSQALSKIIAQLKKVLKKNQIRILGTKDKFTCITRL